LNIILKNLKHLETITKERESRDVIKKKKQNKTLMISSSLIWNSILDTVDK